MLFFSLLCTVSPSIDPIWTDVKRPSDSRPWLSSPLVTPMTNRWAPSNNRSQGTNETTWLWRRSSWPLRWYLENSQLTISDSKVMLEREVGLISTW
ncbi:hypothetical protein BDV32DRAFT_129014 [Aspergillus pseudonomiae]|nr:hypothetical protein BDV32DRAFT_129014 [Aspergillus pseudonomiae]